MLTLRRTMQRFAEPKGQSSRTSLRAVVAANIRVHRKQLGLSQEALAARCGLHRTYIGSVERAERNVTLSTLETLASALGISVTELLTPSWV